MQKIVVKQFTPFRIMISAVLVLIGLLLGLLIGKVILLILLLIPGVFYAANLIFWELTVETRTGDFTYRTLTQGVRTFTVDDIRSKRISDRHYQSKNEQYEIYVHKSGMSERICMPLQNAAELRAYLEGTEPAAVNQA